MDIFLDFDDTLINRTTLNESVFKAFGDLSPPELHAHYKNFRVQNPFTIAGFSKYISERGVDGEKLRRCYLEAAHRADQHLFADTISFLQELRARGHRLELLTFAPDIEEWQIPKIASSGLKPYFDEIHITDADKIETVRKLNRNQPFVFIDDKQTEIEAMKNAFPDSLCIHHTPDTPLLPYLTQIDAFASEFKK